MDQVSIGPYLVKIYIYVCLVLANGACKHRSLPGKDIYVSVSSIG